MILIIRKKHLLYTFILILALLFGIIFSNNYIVSNNTYEKIIVIDPGHGGRDPGASGKSGISEKDLNLNISLYLKDYFEKNGYKVVLTRDKDISLHNDNSKSKKASDMKNRKKLINEINPLVFISIHLNSFPDDDCYGAQVFYPAKNEKSKILGEMIQEELKNNIDNKNKRAAKPISNIIILKELSMPAALIECGFLSNSQEEKLLNTAEYQQRIAESIYKGVYKFLTMPTIQNTIKVAI